MKLYCQTLQAYSAWPCLHEYMSGQSFTGHVIKKLQASLPLLSERTQAIKALADKNLAPRQSYLELEQKRIEQHHDIATQQARQQEIAAAITTARQQKHALVAQIRTTELTQLAEAKINAFTLEQELHKAKNRQQFQRPTAPVDGVVRNLKIHTVGGV